MPVAVYQSFSRLCADTAEMAQFSANADSRTDNYAAALPLANAR